MILAASSYVHLFNLMTSLPGALPIDFNATVCKIVTYVRFLIYFGPLCVVMFVLHTLLYVTRRSPLLQMTAASFQYYYAKHRVFNQAVMFVFWCWSLLTSSVALRSHLLNASAMVSWMSYCRLHVLSQWKSLHLCHHDAGIYHTVTHILLESPSIRLILLCHSTRACR